MLKTIAEVSPELVDFIEALDLPLSRPQLRHVTQVADALITTDGNKTLSGLYRHIVSDLCPKAAAAPSRCPSLPMICASPCADPWRKRLSTLPKRRLGPTGSFQS